MTINLKNFPRENEFCLIELNERLYYYSSNLVQKYCTCRYINEIKCHLSVLKECTFMTSS